MTTIKVKDDGDKLREDIDWRTYNIERIKDHYERLGVSVVSSNIQMALSVSGVNKENRALGAAITIGFSILQVYMEFKDMLMLRSRMNYMRKMAQGSASYAKAGGIAAVESSTGIMAPVIAAAIGAALAIIALMYTIPKLEKGGVMTDTDIIPLEKSTSGMRIIRNKIYYIDYKTIPFIASKTVNSIGGV